MESFPSPGHSRLSPVDLIELSPTPMVLANASTFRVIDLNMGAATMFRAEVPQLIGEPLNNLLAFDFEALKAATGIGHGVAYLWGQDSGLQSVHLDYRNLDGDVPLTLFALFDSSRVSQALRSELEAARLDATTGALRRDSFVQVLTTYGQHPSQSSYGVLFLDIDDFKRFNDEFGHHFGDTVLATVVEVLRAMLRSNDVIGRFGGDEFVVLLSGRLDFGDIERIASHVERRVASAVSSRLGTSVKASVGAAYCTALTAPIEALKAADAAMYEAKRRRPDRPSVVVVSADEVAMDAIPTPQRLLVN